MEDKCKGLERWQGGENTVSAMDPGYASQHAYGVLRDSDTLFWPPQAPVLNTQTYTQAKHKSHTNKYFLKKTNVRNKWMKVCVFSNMEMNMVGKTEGDHLAWES